MKDLLTQKEIRELIWFIGVVQGWRSGGPYGDGETVTNKKDYAKMDQILKKLESI